MSAREGGKCVGQTGVRAPDLEEAVIERFPSEVGGLTHVVEQLVAPMESDAALIDLEAALAAHRRRSWRLMVRTQRPRH